MNREELEIMAPAGSWEALVAASQAGADAVYFGIEKMNMRARSSKSFRITDLPDIVSFCRTHGMKSYLTLNIVLYDEDLDPMRRAVEAARAAGVSAIIATDISVMEYAHQIGQPLHISTQVNVTNQEAVRWYARYADAMVLARELNLEQVRQIYLFLQEQNLRGPSGKPIRLEMFAHGALCMAISGKCYLSLHEHHKSANRGACYQTCRKAYQVYEKETGYALEIDREYIMSPKDLCTIDFLDKMIESGVRIFKIEGRARAPEYVRTVTHAYHEALNAYCMGKYNRELAKSLKKELGKVFNRGFWDGYYLGRRMGEWSENYGSAATQKKMYLGKVTHYFSNLEVAELLLQTDSLSPSETLMITGPTTGVLEFPVPEVRTDRRPEPIAPKGAVCSVPVPSRVRRSDKVYKLVPATGH